MAQNTVTFPDKQNLEAIVDSIRQLGADDINMLKSVINNNANDVETRLATKSDLVMSEAQAIQLVRIHDTNLNFRGFTHSTSIPFPLVENDAWIADQDGGTGSSAIHGIDNVAKGQIIAVRSGVLVKEDINTPIQDVDYLEEGLNDVQNELDDVKDDIEQIQDDILQLEDANALSSDMDLAQWVDEYIPNFQYAGNTVKYSIMVRVVYNPATKILTSITKGGIKHASISPEKWPACLVLRRSLDDGKTWHGINPIDTETVLPFALDTDYEYGQTGTFVTNTGRIVCIYTRYRLIDYTYDEAYYTYSDDDGVTWATPQAFTAPAGHDRFPAPYANKCGYDSSGNILYPYHQRDGSSSGTVIYLAKSTDNGATWDTDYKIAFDGRSPMLYLPEPDFVDAGNGVFMIVARPYVASTDGRSYPVLMRSTDYGENWDDGTLGYVTKTDIDNYAHGSGYAKLEGDGYDLAQSTNRNGNTVLCAINVFTFNGRKVVALLYFVRNDTSSYNSENYYSGQLRLNYMYLDDYLTNGINANTFDDKMSIKIWEQVYVPGTSGNATGNPSFIETERSIIIVLNEAKREIINDYYECPSYTQTLRIPKASLISMFFKMKALV